MQDTYLYRAIDRAGRISLPMHLRKQFLLDEGIKVEFLVNGDDIIVRRAVPVCALCGEVGAPTAVSGRHVCSDCAQKVKTVIKAEQKDQDKPVAGKKRAS